MTEQISWCAELAVDPARLMEYKALNTEMINLSRREPGTLIYERHISDDQKTIFVYERYANQDAAVSHLRAFDELFSDRFHGMLQRKRFVVFGTPTGVLRSLLDRFGAIYTTSIGGFGIHTR